METSNNIDTNHPWFVGRPIVCAGSSVILEAGSIVVMDYVLDWSHGNPHFNIRLRTSPEGETPRGREVQYLLGSEHAVPLFYPGSTSSI